MQPKDYMVLMLNLGYHGHLSLQSLAVPLNSCNSWVAFGMEECAESAETTQAAGTGVCWWG